MSTFSKTSKVPSNEHLFENCLIKEDDENKFEHLRSDTFLPFPIIFAPSSHINVDKGLQFIVAP